MYAFRKYAFVENTAKTTRKNEKNEKRRLEIIIIPRNKFGGLIVRKTAILE